METGSILQNVRNQKPLVHHITNAVTITDCANITLMCGGLPIMAHAVEEVEEMVEHAQALVLNLGTLTPTQVEAMLLAGHRANALHKPIILDPVGVGATRLRLECSKQLLKELQLSIIKGNPAEIAILAGGFAEIRGVESISVSGSLPPMAAALARETGSVVVATGAVDLITDGKWLVEVNNGHELMSKVVGTGCMTASLMGCFAGVEENCLEAAVAASVSFNVAAELAALAASTPAAFKRELFDCLYTLDVQTVNEKEKIKRRVIGS